MAQITQIAMIIIPASNIEQALEFYQKLGLALKFHVKEKWAEFEIKGVKIGLCPSNTPPTDAHTGIVLAVDNLQALYDQLKNQITFYNEPTQATHGIMVAIKDPSGNILDLYQPTPEKLKEYMDKQEKEGGDNCCGNDQDTCCK